MELSTADLCQVSWGRLLAGEHRLLQNPSLDSRKMKPGGCFFALKGPNFNGHHFLSAAVKAGAAVVVLEAPHQPERTLLDGRVTVISVPSTQRALKQLAIHQRQRFKGQVLGITGSNGKTTTKELLAAVLSELGPTHKTAGNQNNHLGVPLSLIGLSPRHRFAVFEMGMNAPGEIRQLASLVQPELAVITSVGAAHLEGFKDLAAIARAKGELFQALPPQGLAIMPSHINYPWILSYNLRARLELVGARLQDSIYLKSVNPLRRGISAQLQLNRERSIRFRLRLRLSGKYNIYNALLALSAGLSMGVSLEAALHALAQVEPAELRGELCPLSGGGNAILDCYNANPESMLTSLQDFHQRAPDGLLILGDMLELGARSEAAHQEIGRAVAALSGEPSLLCVGAQSLAMAEAARAAGMERVYCAADAEEAGALLLKLRRPAQDLFFKASRGLALERAFEILNASKQSTA